MTSDLYMNHRQIGGTNVLNPYPNLFKEETHNTEPPCYWEQIVTKTQLKTLSSPVKVRLLPCTASKPIAVL